MADISYDNSTDGGSVTASSLTFAHITSGTYRLLFVFCRAGSDIITGVTYGGVAMTQVTKRAGVGQTYMFVLQNPKSGSNDVVITASASTDLYGIASSYCGSKQSTTVDSFNSSAPTGISSGSWTGVSTTTVADRCWVINGAFKTYTGIPAAANGCTTRKNAASICVCDSNGVKTPAGSKTNDVNCGDGTQDWNHIAVSFAPYISSKLFNYRNIEVGDGASRSESVT